MSWLVWRQFEDMLLAREMCELESLALTQAGGRLGATLSLYSSVEWV